MNPIRHILNARTREASNDNVSVLSIRSRVGIPWSSPQGSLSFQWGSYMLLAVRLSFKGKEQIGQFIVTLCMRTFLLEGKHVFLDTPLGQYTENITPPERMQTNNFHVCTQIRLPLTRIVYSPLISITSASIDIIICLLSSQCMRKMILYLMYFYIL